MAMHIFEIKAFISQKEKGQRKIFFGWRISCWFCFVFDSLIA
jgi:hypothetical protein